MLTHFIWVLWLNTCGTFVFRSKSMEREQQLVAETPELIKCLRTWMNAVKGTQVQVISRFPSRSWAVCWDQERRCSQCGCFATPWNTAHEAFLSITTPGVHPNPCPLSLWCHPTISSSVVPFSFFPQSFLASGAFLMSQSLALGSQSIGASASASVFSMNI